MIKTKRSNKLNLDHQQYFYGTVSRGGNFHPLQMPSTSSIPSPFVLQSSVLPISSRVASTVEPNWSCCLASIPSKFNGTVAPGKLQIENSEPLIESKLKRPNLSKKPPRGDKLLTNYGALHISCHQFNESNGGAMS